MTSIYRLPTYTGSHPTERWGGELLVRRLIVHNMSVIQQIDRLKGAEG